MTLTQLQIHRQKHVDAVRLIEQQLHQHDMSVRFSRPVTTNRDTLCTDLALHVTAILSADRRRELIRLAQRAAAEQQSWFNLNLSLGR